MRRWRVRSKKRAQMAQIHAQEADRRLQKYSAVDGFFAGFVFDSKIPDKGRFGERDRVDAPNGVCGGI